MNRWISTTGLAALIALPLLTAPAAALASCHGRVQTGTVVGGVGGALIGNSIAHGGGGAIIGGVGGAVLGHEIAKGGCGDERRVAYHHRHWRHHHHRHDDVVAAHPG